MNVPAKITIKDFSLFAKNHPAAAQAIEELLGVSNAEGTLVLTREQLSKLPEHMLREMVEPDTAAKQREEAITRLETFWQEKGLLNTQANANALVEGLRILNQGFNVAAVDRAIIVLRDQGKLQWRDDKKATPAPAAPAAPAAATPAAPAAPVAPPEPRRLDNGEPELPLNADEWTMRRASKAQLLDLSARRREGRQRPVGWVGSSF